MKVLVLGAGVVGTASAWYLARAGHEVTVVDRQAGAGLETSFANGGQISVSHAEPWANPHVLPKVLKWLGREDAPLLFRWHPDPSLPARLAWGLRFLFECLPGRTHANIGAIVHLALYSRSRLQALRQEIGLDYDQLERGILHIYTDRQEFAAAVEAARLMADFGLERVPINAERCIEIEPALAAARPLLVGGDYTPGDESGDAHKFTQALAGRCAEQGVVFRYGHAIERIAAAGGRIAGVVVRAAGEVAGGVPGRGEMASAIGGPAGVDGSAATPAAAAGSAFAGPGELLTADAYVVALGSYSPLLLKPLGINLPVYPAKGYSATLPLGPASQAPTVSITDDERKIVFSRLGQRLRIAGTAEFSGYNLELNPVRCQALTARAAELFPALRPAGAPQFWCGLRPATPSNVPLIGKTRYANLWLNTGHGTLGWTMACGSGAVLADLMSGRRPEPEFPFLKC